MAKYKLRMNNLLHDNRRSIHIFLILILLLEKYVCKDRGGGGFHQITLNYTYV